VPDALNRSQSEEHILSPGGLSLGKGCGGSGGGLFSPVRGTTPEPSLMTMSLHAGRDSSSNVLLASPRNPRVKVKRNDTTFSVAAAEMAVAASTEDGYSPFRNMNYEGNQKKLYFFPS
jgi:hypothetical protein